MPFEGPQSTRRFFVGLDLGQRRDYTALIVLERIVTPFWGEQWIHARNNETCTRRLHVRMAEKVRLGTPYPEIVEWVESILKRPEFERRTALTVDATGVGAPVVDLLRKAKLGANLVAVTITGGNNQQAHNPSTGTIPRHVLLTALQLAIQRDEIEIADSCAQAEALRQELRHLKLDGTIYGHHDDLSIALALAVWSSKRNH